MRITLIALTLVTMILFITTDLSHADGCYIPEAKKKMPDIPYQRALIQHKGGMESLIIESTLNGSGGNYGWIVPIPNPPFKFEKISPGLLKTLSAQIQPEIRHVDRGEKILGMRYTTLFMIIILTISLSILKWGAEGGLIAFVSIVCFAIFILPNLMYYGAGSGSMLFSASENKVMARHIVGDYDVAVLEVKDSSALNIWLEKNGFSTFAPEAVAIVDDYIQKGWHFTAAKLRTVSDGTTTPHPILMKFKSDTPVYPMRLTALPDTPVYLELFVVAGDEVFPKNYSLNKEYCDYFGEANTSNNMYVEPDYGEKVFKSINFANRHNYIAHPDSAKVLWQGCVVTKFAGEVASNKMKEDMVFDYKSAIPFQAKRYSYRAIVNISYDKGVFIAMITAIILAVYYRNRFHSKVGRQVIERWALTLLVAYAIGFGITYASLSGKMIDIMSIDNRSWISDFRSEVFNVFADAQNTFSTGPELIEVLRREGVDNPITGEPLLHEDSPGNIIFEKSDPEGEEVIRVCDTNGVLIRL